MLSYYFSAIKGMLNIGKKILLVIIVYLFIMGLFAYFINKDKPKVQSFDPVKKNREQIYKTLNNPELQKTKDGKKMLGYYKTGACILLGEACTNNPSDGDVNYKKSVFGFMTNLLVLPYANPPASGVFWAVDGLKNAGFIPKTYAAEGIGFSALKPFSNLWKVFRDVAYMLLVLVLVAIGFMIMFRRKLNPQTVISVESALPRIVLALLLITFSFAIAGFLIDFMYIVIGIGVSIISNNNTFYSAPQFTNDYINASPWKIVDSVFPKNDLPLRGTGLTYLTSIGNSILAMIGPQWAFLLRTLTGILGGILGTFTLGHLTNSVADFAKILASLLGGNAVSSVAAPFIAVLQIFWALLLGGVLSGLGFFIFPQLLLGIFIGLTIIFLMFRVFFMLLKAYLQILLLIIFAPVILVFEAVPGRNAFGFWFKNLFAEIITFPVVIIILTVGYVLVNSFSSNNNSWTPPFLSTNAIGPNAYSIFLGLGLVFLIPDLVKVVKELIGVKGLPVNVGVGTFFGGVGAVGGGAMGTLGSIGSLSLGIQALTGKSLHDIVKSPGSLLTPGKPT